MGKRIGERTRKVLQGVLAVIALGACAEEAGRKLDDEEALAWVRGRVTDVAGAPLADMDVRVDGASVRTDATGRFALRARTDREARVVVTSAMYSSAELPVSVVREGGAQVEVAVKPRRTLMLRDAAQGGRLESDDGFAIELPADALRDARGAAITGEVEVRYALINRPGEITAAPGRMQATDRKGLDGFGLAEVAFYRAGERIRLSKEMQVEVPLYEGHGLSEGQQVDLYALSDEDARWRASARAEVRENRAILRASRDAWLGAAMPLADVGCVRGKLAIAGERPAVNATVRAARGRGLALIQADTDADGNFCMPVTPDDEWRVSTFVDDGAGAFALSVDLRSDSAHGMCGGATGCKDIGSVTLPPLASP